MNDDRLSDREHAEMRDIVLAGTHKIRRSTVRRAQFAAGAAALALVAAVAGGAVSAATLLGSNTSASPSQTATPEPSPTDTPDPTPSAEPTPSTAPAPTVPPGGVLPYGGDCANALSEEEVSALRANGLPPSQFRWKAGAIEVIGGIDCLWLSRDIYMDAEVSLFAFPDSVVPAEVRDATRTGCAAIEWDTSRVKCTVVGVVDETWLVVSATGPGADITAPEVEALYASAASRMGDFAAPAPAERTGEWWSLPDCAQLASQIDPAVYGYDSVAPVEYEGAPSTPGTGPESVAERNGTSLTCDLHFLAGSGDSTRGEVVTVTVIPGGGAYFGTVEVAENAESASVEGAQRAVWVPGLNRYEGSPQVLVVTDGVNDLLVSPDGPPSDWRQAAPLAAALLQLMG